LRNRRFFSLAALNQAIRTLLDDLNDRPLRGWGRSRRQLFEEIERPALTPLPPEPYEYAEWKRCRVGLDYHVEIAKHHYSVRHHRPGQALRARAGRCGLRAGARAQHPVLHLGRGHSEEPNRDGYVPPA
jgi:hypothetical protein